MKVRGILIAAAAVLLLNGWVAGGVRRRVSDTFPQDCFAPLLKKHNEAIAAIRADKSDVRSAGKAYIQKLNEIARRLNASEPSADYRAVVSEKERFARDFNPAAAANTELPAAALDAGKTLLSELARAERKTQERLVAQHRRYRMILLDRERMATASDDDDEADAIRREITRIEAFIRKADEDLARRSRGSLRAANRLPAGLERGLILHYPFDTRNGSRAEDVSGAGNHGAVSGAVWSRSGRRGGAYRLDGLDDFIRTAPTPALRFGPAFTVSMCLHRGVNQTAGGGLSEYLLSKSNPSRADYWIYLTPSGLVGAGFRTAKTERPAALAPAHPARFEVKTGCWAHVVVRCDGKTANVYVNGRLDKTAAVSGLGFKSDAPLQIGRCGRTRWNYGFAGLIDDVMIWKRALNEAEILGLWLTLKASASKPDQLGSWPTGREDLNGKSIRDIRNRTADNLNSRKDKSE